MHFRDLPAVAATLFPVFREYVELAGLALQLQKVVVAPAPASVL